MHVLCDQGAAFTSPRRRYKATTLAAAIADLMRQESLPALERRLKRYTQVDLLILDEIRRSVSPTKGRKMKSQPKAAGKAASRLISERIAELGDWRGDTLARMRALIREADPDVVEEWKWMGTPVWSHEGGICTGESYKSMVKLTFFKGASLRDPAKLFNSSLDGNARRAIDIHQGEVIDANAFKTLIRAAVALNLVGNKKSTKRK